MICGGGGLGVGGESIINDPLHACLAALDDGHRLIPAQHNHRACVRACGSAEAAAAAASVSLDWYFPAPRALRRRVDRGWFGRRGEFQKGRDWSPTVLISDDDEAPTGCVAAGSWILDECLKWSICLMTILYPPPPIHHPPNLSYPSFCIKFSNPSVV